MTITADFSGGEKTATTEPLYQWDTGQKLALLGLPATSTDIQVHFANAAMAQAIVKATATENSLPTCDIPNEFLQFGSAAKARAWVFYKASSTEGYTVRTVLIPVIPRKRPNDYVSPEDPDSHGIVERAIELLEGYEDDLASKLSAAPGAVDTENLADESVTVEKVADDLAAVINAKEEKSNKKTTLTGNESSNDFYPTTKAVVDYARQISFAHENNESAYDDGGVYIDDATDITKMYYVKNSNWARVGILFCVQTPGYNYASQVKIDAFGNITVRVKTKESGEANYTWKSWTPVGTTKGVYDYLNGGVDELVFPANTTNESQGVGVTSNLYVEAGKTYLFRDESERHISGSLYVVGHNQNEFLFQLPADGSPVAYTPQFSGYIRMFVRLGIGDTGGTVRVRMLDLNSALGCVKGSAIELTTAQRIADAGISSLAELPPQSISYAGYQICAANFQDSPWDDGTGIILSLTCVQGAKIYKTTNLACQIAFHYVSEALNRNEIAFRRRNPDGTYTGWHYVHENGRVFYANPSNFIEVIGKAVSVQDSSVYLSQGTYNLFDSTHDEAFWLATATGNSNHPYMGIMLSNHVHLIGFGNVVINANYTGTNQTIRNELSIFNISGYASLENLKLVGENIEYLIHDDSSIVGVSGAYKFTMKNCVLEHNGTILENGDGAPVCVGGGCSEGKRVVIEDCVLSSVSDSRTLIYHTTLNHKANILIKGCVFPLAGNTIHIRNMRQGTTPNMTCVVRDCSLGAPLLLGLMDGVTLHEFNNTVSSYEGYVRGTVDRTTGELLAWTYNYRIVQCEIARADVALYVRCADSSYKFAVITYNADGTMINYRDYGTNCFIERGTRYRITVRKVTEDTSQPADVAEFASKVVINKDIVFDYPLTRMPKYMVGAMSYRPLGTLSKGYICFSTDDGRHELSTYTVPMFIRKNVPLTMCLWSTSQVMTDSAEKAQIIAAITSPATAKYTTGANAGQVINASYSHSKNFEVAQHGNDPWADGVLNAGRPDDGTVIHTPFDEKSLYDFWESENAAFAAQGITVAKSAACPYGYTNQRMIAQAGGYFGVHRSVYTYGDDYNTAYSYYCSGPRSNIFTIRAANIKGYSLPRWKAAVDYAIANNYLLCIYFHDWDLSTTGRDDSITDDGGGTSLSAAARLEALIDYAKQQGITFCNLSDIPHLV